MKKIIVMDGEKDKELNMSMYEFVDELYRKAIPMIVCNVTKEEYEIMLKQVKSGGLKERLPRITSQELEYDRFRYLLVNDATNNVLRIANYENPDQKGSYVVDYNGIHYNENELQFPKAPQISRIIGWKIRIYTTETYEEVIEYYKGRHNAKRIYLLSDEIERIEGAYRQLSTSSNIKDYSDENLKEFRDIFKNIIEKLY